MANKEKASTGKIPAGHEVNEEPATYPTNDLSARPANRWLRWQAANPSARRAHRAIDAAVRGGKITKPTACQSCGAETRLDGHHDDYSRPLDVEWLCRGCHGHRHAQQRRQARGGDA